MLETGKLVYMSKRALESSAHQGWLENTVWENGAGGVVLLIPEREGVWRGFVMSESATLEEASSCVEMFSELYFSEMLGLREAWLAAVALCGASRE